MLCIKLVNVFLLAGFVKIKVAIKLRVTEQYVLDLIEEGKLQAINIGGGGGTSGAFQLKHIRHL